MPITVKEVKTKKELVDFVKFPIKLFKGTPQWVPPMIDFELSTLLKKKNPAFEFCDARYWLAYKGKEIVGRIAGIIHGREIKDKPVIRFGWIDFIDDQEVSQALFDQVTSWAKERDLTAIQGPMGFTDLDFEGMLVEGFDQPMTQATLWNPPYYVSHLEKLGFKKQVDWVQYRKQVPEKLPVDSEKVALIGKRYGIHVKQVKSKKDLLNYAKKIFNLLNAAYSHLHGFYPLTEKQVDYFIEQYFGFAKKEFIILIVDDQDDVIGFAISFPSLSKALKKSNGTLFPFGFIHLLKAFYINDVADLFLIAASDGYKNRGTNALIWNELVAQYIKFGIKECYTGQMLEENSNVLNLNSRFEDVDSSGPIRRRCFVKNLE